MVYFSLQQIFTINVKFIDFSFKLSFYTNEYKRSFERNIITLEDFFSFEKESSTLLGPT